MYASVEKNKVAYITRRSPEGKINASSPHEAHKAHCVTFALCALDTAFENPIFAALEVDYSEVEAGNISYEEAEKTLVYYEIDLGLNHVVRKWVDPVEYTSHKLFAIPGGADGPSGVLVCAEDSITYRHNNQEVLRVPIPRRKGMAEDPNRKRIIVAGAVHKVRGDYFGLLQSEDGDIFKVWIEMEEDKNGHETGKVRKLKIKYFDTVPRATSLCILRSGYLYVAAEAGDHRLYLFASLAQDDDEIEWESRDAFSDYRVPLDPISFVPRGLRNLKEMQVMKSLAPQMKSKIDNITGEDASQIYSICGSGANSSLKTTKHGLRVEENDDAEELPGIPHAIWSIKTNLGLEYDDNIIVSFSNTTLVLKIGEDLEQVSDTKFNTGVATIAVQLLGEDSLVQIHSRGMRHVTADGAVDEWPAPAHRTIVAAATNRRQICLALSSGELAYFELDSDGALAEFSDRREISGTVTSLDMGMIPEGRERSMFVVVGCDDQTIRVLSLDVDSCLQQRSVQALSAVPTSIKLIPMEDSHAGGQTSFVHVGLYSGVYLRAVIDPTTGELGDVRSRFLGPRPTKVFSTTFNGQSCVLALSSRPWLGYSQPVNNNFTLTPLDYLPLVGASHISSGVRVPEGVIGILGRHMRVFRIQDLESNLIQQEVKLRYTPRDFCRHPDYPYCYVIQSEQNTLSEKTIASIKASGDTELEPLPYDTHGLPRAQGHWASCIQVIDPITNKTCIHEIQLEDNEAAIACAMIPFRLQGGEHMLLISVSKNMTTLPFSTTGSYVYTYRLTDDGTRLDLLHKTSFAHPVRCMIPFQGRMALGEGNTLLIYDCGNVALLRKARATACVPNEIVSIRTQGSRLVVADVQESVTYVVYKHVENRLIPFADDTVARYSTVITMLDYETTAGGDKFGNFWIVRCPKIASEEADEASSAHFLLHEKG
ncbi:pre-mRNA-splicing factor rse1, partial [Elasticomyces elasticus]